MPSLLCNPVLCMTGQHSAGLTYSRAPLQPGRPMIAACRPSNTVAVQWYAGRERLWLPQSTNFARQCWGSSSPNLRAQTGSSDSRLVASQDCTQWCTPEPGLPRIVAGQLASTGQQWGGGGCAWTSRPCTSACSAAPRQMGKLLVAGQCTAMRSTSSARDSQQDDLVLALHSCPIVLPLSVMLCV